MEFISVDIIINKEGVFMKSLMKFLKKLVIVFFIFVSFIYFIDKQSTESVSSPIERKNASDNSMWKVSYYVDEFGEPTKSGYIKNKNNIYGKFSNSIAEGAKLRVLFLLSSYSDADIQLFHYDGKKPVQAFISNYYTILIRDKNGKKHKLTGDMHKGSDRISLDESSSKKLHSILKKDGKIDFRIKLLSSLTNYSFSLNNTNGYYTAYKKLHKIK